jgi:hypothetical protein
VRVYVAVHGADLHLRLRLSLHRNSLLQLGVVQGVVPMPVLLLVLVQMCLGGDASSEIFEVRREHLDSCALLATVVVVVVVPVAVVLGFVLFVLLVFSAVEVEPHTCSDEEDEDDGKGNHAGPKGRHPPSV